MSRKIVSVSLALSTVVLLAGYALPAAGAAYSFTRSLFLGTRGDDVKALQQYLNSAGFMVAASGPGSPGNETTYFGPLTKAAVAKWQAANGVSPAAGYFGPISRAKYAEIVGGGSAPPPVSGALNVSVVPMVNGALVADTGTSDSSQARAAVLKLQFAGSGTVTQLRINRIGISSDSDIKNAYLYDGDSDVRLADSPAVSNGYFTFANANGLFSVSGSRVITFKVDLATNPTVAAGKTFQFGVAALSDVVGFGGTTIGGSAPAYGAVFTVAQVSDLGQLNLVSSSPSADTGVDPGNLNYEVWRFTAQASDQQVKVRWIKFTMVGTADYDSVQNLALYVDGVQVGSTVPVMNTDKTVVFDLNANPIVINSGATRTFGLRGDIVKGSSRNFYFQLQSPADFLVRDANYNVGINVKAGGNLLTGVFKASGITNGISINPGSVSVQKSSDAATGPYALNATALSLARFDLKAVGEDIKVTALTLNLATSTPATTTASSNMKNVKVLVGGVQFGTNVSSLAFGTDQTFNGSYIVKAGTTAKIEVFADIISSGTALTTNDNVKVVLKQGSGNGQRMFAGTTLDVPGADTSANVIAFAQGTFAAVKNGAVANLTTVKGASGVTVGSWLLTAPSEQAVNVTSITINNATGTPGLGSAFDALALYSGGVQYGQTINSPSAATGTPQTFNFSTALNIPAGQTKQIDLKANIITNADASWTGAADDGVKITNVAATGVVTNSTVSYASGDVLGQTVNIKAGPGLTIAGEVMPTMPASQYLVTGDTAQTLAAWKLSADNTEDIRINRVKLIYNHTDNAAGNLQNLRLYVGGVQVGGTAPAFNGTASGSTILFEDQTNGLFTVPMNSSIDMVLKADITGKANATFLANGAGVRVSFQETATTTTTLTNVTGKGVTSGAFSTLALDPGTCASNTCSSNEMKVVKTKPTLALVSPASTVLVPGYNEVFRFRITAHSDGDVVLGATHNIRFTLNSSPSTATAFNFDLYDAVTNATIANTQAAAVASGGTVNFSAGLSTTIPAGQTKEYYVKANTSNFSSTGNSFQLVINNAATDFSWSDTSNAQNPSIDPDINNANYTGYGLPMFGPIYVK